MQAISISSFGGPEQLSLTDLPTPEPGPGEVLIHVAAAGVNRADLHQREGHYPPPEGASPLPGLEVSGEIAAVGPEDHDGWQTGNRVCALLPGGGYAEYAVASGGSCLPVPEAMPLADAAALPEAVFTVWANLFSAVPGRVHAGERLLVQGGPSGVGSMAIQMGHAFGVHVAATAGSAERAEQCRALGAEFAVDYHGDWVAGVHGWAPDGVDAVLDMIAGSYFENHLALLATGGRLTHIAFAGGATVSLDVGTVMRKRLVVTGSTLRSRAAEAKRVLRDEIAQSMWPLFGQGLLRPLVHKRYPFAEAAEAHRAMASGGLFGKLLLVA